MYVMVSFFLNQKFGKMKNNLNLVNLDKENIEFGYVMKKL
jgi:hypothetical protein